MRSIGSGYRLLPQVQQNKKDNPKKNLRKFHFADCRMNVKSSVPYVTTSCSRNEELSLLPRKLIRPCLQSPYYSGSSWLPGLQLQHSFPQSQSRGFDRFPCL